MEKKIPLNIKNKENILGKKKGLKRKESSPESSDNNDHSINDSTHESPDRSQNVNCKCLFVMVFFLKMFMEMNGSNVPLVGDGLMKIVLA
ncbi:hypothetical protein JTB14_037658 [Gonioctena quinquepunctata]|nr:hypothetical protein JTB14_037658 [Gonioctena quinquepunctata]